MQSFRKRLLYGYAPGPNHKYYTSLKHLLGTHSPPYYTAASVTKKKY
jgi:hypothetical protein